MSSYHNHRIIARSPHCRLKINQRSSHEITLVTRKSSRDHLTITTRCTIVPRSLRSHLKLISLSIRDHSVERSRGLIFWSVEKGVLWLSSINWQSYDRFLPMCHSCQAIRPNGEALHYRHHSHVSSRVWTCNGKYLCYERHNECKIEALEKEDHTMYTMN